MKAIVYGIIINIANLIHKKVSQSLTMHMMENMKKNKLSSKMVNHDFFYFDSGGIEKNVEFG